MVYCRAFPTPQLPILSSHHHITSSSSHRSGHYSSLRQTTTPLLVLFLLVVFQEGGHRGGYGRPRGEGRRNAPRQGCLGRRSGPGTRLTPRSQPPRAPLALFPPSRTSDEPVRCRPRPGWSRRFSFNVRTGLVFGRTEECAETPHASSRIPLSSPPRHHSTCLSRQSSRFGAGEGAV